MRFRFCKAILLVAFVLPVHYAFAQTDGLGSWNVLSARYTVNARWVFFGEAQLRSQQFYYHYNYTELKGGIGYNFKSNASVLLGGGYYETFLPVGDFQKPLATEFRTWQQLVLTNNLNRLKLEHRYRIEQRYTASGFRNRFRYRLNALFPLNNKTITEKTWYLSVFNEMFVSNEAPFFVQNRMFAGVGYQFDEKFTIISGILHRFDNISPALQTWKNYFQVNLLFSLKEFKTGRERHPSAMD